MEEIHFVYVTTKNKVAAYTLSSPGLHGNYLQGHCNTRGGYRTFIAERVIDFFETPTEADSYVAELLDTDFSDFSFEGRTVSNPNRKNYTRYESPGMYQPLDFSGALEICFTGFKKADKERLSKLAAAAGMIVRNDITVNLHLLCGGYNAGPKKLEVARKKGTMIVRESELLTLLETGELPDDYDDK